MRSGIPIPAYLGFPSDVATAKIRTPKELTYYFDKSKTSTDTEPYPDPKAVKAAAAMLQKAQRPIIVCGHGVMRTKAFDILEKFAEKTQIPVTEGGAQRGKFSDGHPLCASASHKAYESADLVLIVGYYKIPGIGGWAFDPGVKFIRIHPDPHDIGRQLPIEVGIVSSEKAALEALYEAMPSMKHDTWIAEIRKAEDDYEAEKAAMEAEVWSLWKDHVHPAHIGKGIVDLVQKGKIPRDQTTFVSGGFGIARFIRPYIRAFRPGQILNGPYWEIVVGPDVAYTVGVGMAMETGAGVQKPYKGGPIIMTTGDAGIGITAMEMSTLRKYHIPAVNIVWSNNTWGTWRSRSPADPKAPRERREHVHLYQENIRYDLLASSLGCYGAYVTKPEDFPKALESCYNVAVRERIPSLINCQGIKESIDKRWPPAMWGAPRPGAMSYHY
jgi:thiamine pyrophosphate-dependent acetolactate synthase large subunit-like protein